MWTIDTYQLVMCMGCNAATLRHVSVFSEDLPDQTVKLYPPRSARKKPHWVSQLGGGNKSLSEILDEVYIAVEGEARRLVAMGIRSVLEYVMLEKVGDQGTFQDNLDAFEVGHFISGTQRKIVETVIDVGSATIHRGYLPTRNDTEALLGVMESVVKTIYIDEPAIQRIKVPPRPPRKSAAGAAAPAAGSPTPSAGTRKVTKAPPPPTILKP